jgi:hypothetical protein
MQFSVILQLQFRSVLNFVLNFILGFVLDFVLDFVHDFFVSDAIVNRAGN